MEIQITSYHSGENIKPIELNNKANTVKLEQDLRDSM